MFINVSHQQENIIYSAFISFSIVASRGLWKHSSQLILYNMLVKT